MSDNTDNCCEPTDLNDVKYNPHLNTRTTNRRRGKMFNFIQQNNPIEKQVRDSADVTAFFQKYPLIPFASNNIYSGQRLLRFFLDMYLLSPTHSACINNQKVFAFGSKIETKKSLDSVFDLDDETVEATKEEKIGFTTFLKEFQLNFTNWKKLGETLFVDYKTTGNAYFVLTMGETLGVPFKSINRYRPEEVLYAATKKGQTKKLVFSEKWEDQYITENPPMVVPLFPETIETSSGSIMTAFHIKDESFEWYGRPDSVASFMEQYREYQNNVYLSNQSDAGFVGQVLIEVEGEDVEGDDDEDAQEAGFANKSERLEQSFTNKSDDPLTILFLERPFGSKQAFVKQFMPNTNENFFKVTGTLAGDRIISTHQWSRKLLGESSVQGLSNNQFIDELKTKLPMIDDLQFLIEEPLNKAIDYVIEKSGNQEFKNLGIKFRMPFKLMLDVSEKTDPTIGMGGSKIQPSYEGLPA